MLCKALGWRKILASCPVGQAEIAERFDTHVSATVCCYRLTTSCPGVVHVPTLLTKTQGGFDWTVKQSKS